MIIRVGVPGPSGPASRSATTAAYTQPAVDASVSIAVTSTAWMAAGQTIFIEGAGYYQVGTIASLTSLTAINIGSFGNAAAGTVIATGADVVIGAVGGAGNWSGTWTLEETGGDPITSVSLDANSAQIASITPGNFQVMPESSGVFSFEIDNTVSNYIATTPMTASALSRGSYLAAGDIAAPSAGEVYFGVTSSLDATSLTASGGALGFVNFVSQAVIGGVEQSLAVSIATNLNSVGANFLANFVISETNGGPTLQAWTNTRAISPVVPDSILTEVYIDRDTGNAYWQIDGGTKTLMLDNTTSDPIVVPAEFIDFCVSVIGQVSNVTGSGAAGSIMGFEYSIDPADASDPGAGSVEWDEPLMVRPPAGVAAGNTYDVFNPSALDYIGYAAPTGAKATFGADLITAGFAIPNPDAATDALTGTVANIASLPSAASSSGYERYVTSARAWFRSNGTAWQQTSIGTFDTLEISLLDPSDFNGVRVFNADLWADFVSDGTEWRPVGMDYTIPVTPPFEFTEFNVYRDGLRSFRTDYDFESNRPFTDAEADAIIYADIATGSDSNPGTEVSPVKSLFYSANARTGKVIIRAKAGVYDGTNTSGFGFRNADTSAITHLIVEPWGDGRVVSSVNRTTPTWSKTGGYTNVYEGAVSTTVRAMADLSQTVTMTYEKAVFDFDEAYESARPLMAVSSIAACDALPGSWYWTSSVLYVHAFNSAAPTADYRPYLSGSNLAVRATGGVLWARNLDLYGGERGLDYTPTSGATAQIFLSRCTFKHAGGNVGNGISTRGPCVIISESCVGMSNNADGLNYHDDSKSGNLLAAEINCAGANNGWDGKTTNNGSTIHDIGRMVRVMGDYVDNQDRAIHDIDDSRVWMAGCSARNNRVDGSTSWNYRAGLGSLSPADETQMWLDCCDSSESTGDLSTQGDSVIYTYALVSGGVNEAGSDIQTYEPWEV